MLLPFNLWFAKPEYLDVGCTLLIAELERFGPPAICEYLETDCAVSVTKSCGFAAVLLAVAATAEVGFADDMFMLDDAPPVLDFPVSLSAGSATAVLRAEASRGVRAALVVAPPAPGLVQTRLPFFDGADAPLPKEGGAAAGGVFAVIFPLVVLAELVHTRFPALDTPTLACIGAEVREVTAATALAPVIGTGEIAGGFRRLLSDKLLGPIASAGLFLLAALVHTRLPALDVPTLACTGFEKGRGDVGATTAVVDAAAAATADAEAIPLACDVRRPPSDAAPEIFELEALVEAFVHTRFPALDVPMQACMGAE